MITEEIRDAIRNRASTDDEWSYGVEQCWNKEIDILSRDINATIDFLEHDCTAEEFSWLSEIFDDIAKNTHSKDFISALRRTAEKYPEETMKYHIHDFIDSAECIVDSQQL